jgi:hypothetical protein
MRSLDEIIADVIDSDLSAEFDDMTHRVFTQLGCPAKWATIFHPLMRDEIRRHHRSAMVAALSATRPDGQARIDTHDLSAVGSGRSTRVVWLDATVETFGKWGRVPFGAMTIEMHESRIAAQKRLQGGIQSDIDMHADAITEITTAGVSCLNDIHRPSATKGAA